MSYNFINSPLFNYSIFNDINLYFDMYYDIISLEDDELIGTRIKGTKYTYLAKTILLSNDIKSPEPLILFRCDHCSAPIIQTMHTAKKSGENSNCNCHEDTYFKNIKIGGVSIGNRRLLQKEFNKMIKTAIKDKVGISYDFSIYWKFLFWAFKTNYQPGQTLFRFDNEQMFCEQNCYWGWELSNLPVWDNYKEKIMTISEWNNYFNLPEKYIENKFFSEKNIKKENEEPLINLIKFINKKLHPYDNPGLFVINPPPIRTYNSFYLDFRF